MNCLLISFIAAIIASASNFFFRKNNKDDANGYLLFYYLSSFLMSLVIFPQVWSQPFSFPMLAIGSIAGIMTALVMSLTGLALKHGPAGLTFSFQNASSIFPAILLFFCFGSEFGYQLTYQHIIGISLVLFGLFFGSFTKKEISGTWLKYVLGCFLFQILTLTFIQGRCLLFDLQQLSRIEDVWFMPAQFGAASIIQSGILFIQKRKIEVSEFNFGLLGGLMNSFSTALLLFSTKWALPHEKSILFPLFSISVLTLCNLWAYKVYREQFNLKTNTICAFGILIATFI